MLVEKEIIKEFGQSEYNSAAKKVWANLTQGQKNSIEFQSLLKLTVKELEA